MTAGTDTTTTSVTDGTVGERERKEAMGHEVTALTKAEGEQSLITGGGQKTETTTATETREEYPQTAGGGPTTTTTKAATERHETGPTAPK